MDCTEKCAIRVNLPQNKWWKHEIFLHLCLPNIVLMSEAVCSSEVLIAISQTTLSSSV
jgi:hypothetical protein